MTPHNRLMALFTLEGDARPSRDFYINPGGQPGRDKGKFTPRARLADLFEYYADPLHRQRLFTHLLGVALDIYLLDAFLTAMNHETFTINSLDSLLSLDALAKVDGGAWHGLPPAEKSAVDMLWRQCIKDELPIVYYAAMLGFGDVPVGHEEFATLFAGSLYVYQQKNADLPPTRQALSQTGEALLNVLVNETLELQLLGYLSLPALFFATKHTKPAPLNAQQAANIDYKLEAVVLFKAFWRTHAAELYSTSALLRRYAQSVVDCLPRTVPTPARVPRQAPRNARAMRQWEQEGNAVARPGGQWGASFADVRPRVDEQRPLNLADESANDNKMKRAAEVAEHFSAIDSLLLFDTLSRLTGYDAQQLCSDQAEIHVLEPFVSELGDYQSRHAYPPISLPAKAVSGGLPFATLKKSVDLLAVCDSACAQKMDHFKHIYALKFQQDHYDIIRLDYDIASYLDYDLFDFHTDYAFFDEMRRREQLVLNINTPGDRSRLIKPAGDPTVPGLIDFLQKKTPK
ncbi:hypothetical protein [Sodalis sp. (in: enterobacteria)]|uniref:hypothetical protein n=1 Tax=Sodalis sp. (in: enterobacteria) TaxID=1898979 RepID=UPI003F35B459